MKENLKELALFLLDNKETILYSAYALVGVIITISVVSAWRSRGVIASPYDSESETLHGDDLDDDIEGYEGSGLEGEDYDDQHFLFDEWVEAYVPKLIRGLIISVAVLGLVALPYFVIQNYIS